MSEQEISAEPTEQALIEPAAQEVETAQSETATDETAQEAPDYQKIIAEKAFETRQAQREKKELERKLEEIQAQAPKEQRPDLPALPDQYDDDYETRIRERDQALIAQAQFDARQRLTQERQQQAEFDRQQQAQQKRYDSVAEYSKRATSLGVTTEELQAAGTRLQGMVSSDVESYILDSDKGPLMTKYLAANPLELDTLNQLNPMQAAVYLETQVKSKAEQYGQKKVTSAPDPTDTLSGGGAAPKNRGPSGAKFE